MKEERERIENFADEIPQTNNFVSKNNLNNNEEPSHFTKYLEQKEKLELSDISWKNWARKFFGYIFTGLLLLQNSALITFVYKSYTDFRTNDLKIMLTVIVPATLIETAFIIRIIVTWIFSNTDYFNHKDSRH